MAFAVLTVEILESRAQDPYLFKSLHLRQSNNRSTPYNRHNLTWRANKLVYTDINPMFLTHMKYYVHIYILLILHIFI